MEDKCPLCGSTKVVYADGEVVCSNCGAVIRQDEFERERRSQPGVRFSAVEHKFAEQHERSEEDARIMKTFASQLSVPQIVQDEAELIIRKLYASRKRPNDPNGVALAALYIAMRMHNMPVSFADMKKLGLSGRTLNRVVKAINPRLPVQTETIQ